MKLVMDMGEMFLFIRIMSIIPRRLIKGTNVYTFRFDPNIHKLSDILAESDELFKLWENSPIPVHRGVQISEENACGEELWTL
jgi:hypothetical protein